MIKKTYSGCYVGCQVWLGEIGSGSSKWKLRLGKSVYYIYIHIYTHTYIYIFIYIYIYTYKYIVHIEWSVWVEVWVCSDIGCECRNSKLHSNCFLPCPWHADFVSWSLRTSRAKLGSLLELKTICHWYYEWALKWHLGGQNAVAQLLDGWY
jgi:hypothetical protein